jgi:hypothetical protein
MGRFETQWLAAGKNLSPSSISWPMDRHSVHDRRPLRGVVLKMDSSVSPTRGEQ